MKLSVIVSTYKRKECLRRLLRSLVNENPDEIIVVSQVEKAQLAGVKEIFLKKPSMTRARNVGVKKAKSNLLLFLDDDAVARPGIIATYKKSFSDPLVAAVCGRVITKGQNLESNNRHVGKVNSLGVVSGGYSSTIPQEIDSVVGCNMCWRRDVFLALGGVDEKFTGNALREETDICLRAKRCGYKIMFEPKASVDHVRAEIGGARKSEGRIQWYFDFFSNETYFFLKYCRWIFFPLFLVTRIEWFVRAARWSLAIPFFGIRDGLRKYYE